LVVDAISGAFDAGFNKGGQTREHAILIRSMGIEDIIVCVNKIDAVGYSKDRYTYITSLMQPFLEEIGFKEQNIHMLPISGLTGDNLHERSKKEEFGWYEGPILTDILGKYYHKIIQTKSKPEPSLDQGFRQAIQSDC
jgi:Translation elongation factor EF-1alpha (GTPase)